MRVLLDTNVWISGLLFGGTPARILALAIAHQIELVSSQPLLDELAEVLSYPKLQPRLNQLQITANELLLTVQASVILCAASTLEPVPELRDPDDVVVLSAAVAANAIVIVSGDNDLLSLGSFAGILIMTASQFLEHYFPTLEPHP